MVLVTEPTLSYYVHKSVLCVLNNFSVKHFGDLIAMIGLDALDKQVFDLCIHHKSPDGDLHGDQTFTLAGMEMTLDC
jgi:hypothetical protein